jgi:hypothetical protein
MAAAWKPGDPLYDHHDTDARQRPILEIIEDEPLCEPGWCWCQDPPTVHSVLSGTYRWTPALAATIEAQSC